MRIPIVEGRGFAVSDDANRPWVAIVSRRLAAAMWPNQNPLGKRISWPSTDGKLRQPLEVVGVAADTRHELVTGPLSPVLYIPVAQHIGYKPGLTLVTRTRGDRPFSARALQRLVASIDPSVQVSETSSLVDRIAAQLKPQRTAGAWIGVFGGIALLLASIGLYGIVAQAVLQRTRELAVRSALGATPGGLHALVMREGMRLAALGVVFGAGGGVWALRLLRTIFSGLGTVDASAVIITLSALGAALTAASYIPARRAARMNPVDALRSD